MTQKYGLDPKTVPPKELFETFHTFAKEFQTTYKKFIEKQKAEEERRKREARKKKAKMEMSERMTVETEGLNFEQLKEKLKQAELTLQIGKKDSEGNAKKVTRRATKIVFAEPKSPPKVMNPMNQSMMSNMNDCSIIGLE